jgi:hypothetical protein
MTEPNLLQSLIMSKESIKMSLKKLKSITIMPIDLLITRTYLVVY